MSSLLSVVDESVVGKMVAPIAAAIGVNPWVILLLVAVTMLIVIRSMGSSSSGPAGKKKDAVLFVGLDNSGKTSLFYFVRVLCGLIFRYCSTDSIVLLTLIKYLFVILHCCSLYS